MKVKKYLIAFLVRLTMLALSASSLFGADLFSGAWKMNLTKSTFAPGEALKQAHKRNKRGGRHNKIRASPKFDEYYVLTGWLE